MSEVLQLSLSQVLSASLMQLLQPPQRCHPAVAFHNYILGVLGICLAPESHDDSIHWEITECLDRVPQLTDVKASVLHLVKCVSLNTWFRYPSLGNHIWRISKLREPRIVGIEQELIQVDINRREKTLEGHGRSLSILKNQTSGAVSRPQNFGCT